MKCSTCNTESTVRCPCGECTVVTSVPICPTCEPERLAKWSKANGTKVCNAYVEQQLGQRGTTR